MSHSQAMNYVRGLVGDVDVSGRLTGKSVLELGSYEVNGSIRPLLGLPGRYVGVDHRGGPGVDHISLFHEIPWVQEFDLLISVNTFEHDPYWKRSLAAGMRALKVDGEIILMAAGPGYPAHEVHCAPVATPSGEYYQNIDPEEFRAELVTCGAVGIVTVFTSPTDVAFHGSKRAAFATG